MGQINPFPVLVPECPVCGGTNRYYSFLMGDERFDECRDCGLLSHMAVVDSARDEELSPLGLSENTRGESDRLAMDFFSLLQGYGCGGFEMAAEGSLPSSFYIEGERRGFSIKRIGGDEKPSPKFDVVVSVDLLEDVSHPLALLNSLRDHLKPGGTLAVLTRQLLRAGGAVTESRILGRHQRHSFSDGNLQTLFWKSGFKEVSLSRHPLPEDVVRGPGWFKDQAIVLGRKSEIGSVPTLSVVLPVFNESHTVRQVMESLAAKRLPGMAMEVIVVESASTDGSREIVKEFEGRPGFTLIFEDRPRGKGFAVRTGLRHAQGEIVLIQDADLEYDFFDYEMLISPILSGKAAFVLGTRHSGHWKIRKFDQYFMADLMNLAHWSLVYLMNRLYGQTMTDPFTMFKVFRRDCLYGLQFECNRFDFDVELVCKLLRKGYTPLEIPVNYQARSFREGKKVNVFRDPLTWVRAMIKYKFSKGIRPPVAPGGQ